MCTVVYSYFEKGCRKKVHATILTGIVGDFKCTVFQRNLKESYGRPLIYVCECWRKVTKVGSTATVVRNSVLIISHITFRDCRVHFILDKLSRNSCTQLHSSTFAWINLHSCALSYTQFHSSTFACLNLHSCALLYTQLHSPTFACINLHSIAFIYIRMY